MPGGSPSTQAASPTTAHPRGKRAQLMWNQGRASVSHLQTGVDYPALLREEHQDLLGKDQALTLGGCMERWATQHRFQAVADTQCQA